MKKRMLCCLLALVLAVGLLSACGSGKAAVYVQSVAALTGYGSLGGANASSGVVVAQKEIKVERDSSRKIKQLNVEVGQEVKSGEVLFTYDMEDMQLTIDKAKLEIEQMKNNVKDLTTQISQLEKEKKSAPTSEQLSYTVQIQALEADKKEAEYNITVKQKELDAMTSGSGTANVTAPVDGKVQAINENGTDSSGNAAAYITLVQDGAYRVKNVKVLKNGKYVDIDPKATYTVASHNYMLKDSGDGINMFADNKLLQDSVMLDNQVLINYIKDDLGGTVPASYAAPQGRISIIATPYTDVVDGNWAVEAVNYVTDKNFMKGLSETTFGPNGALTRGMLVTVLYRMAGSPAVTGKVSEKFSDCTDGSWYADAVLWASANGIVNGYEDGTYKPTKAINRQEMAKVLYGYDKVGGKNAEGITEKLTYTDVDAIGEWAIESVTYCTAAGYLAGSNGAFNPTGTATRAMGAKVLMNMTKEAA